MASLRALLCLILAVGAAVAAFHRRESPPLPQARTGAAHPRLRVTPPAVPPDWYLDLPDALRRDPTPSRFLPALRFHDRVIGSRVPGGFVYWKTIRARVTAYDPSERCCGDSADGFTSLNDNAWVMDGVAIDPRAVPYRSVLEIPGIGLREADDTGSAMVRSWDAGEYHVDVRMPYYYEARLWGVKFMEVKVYRPEMP